MSNRHDLLLNPFNFLALCWPDIKLTKPQSEIVESIVSNRVTIVPAGNDQGKDFIGAFICVWFFCSRSPCKVVTHSVDQPQLKGVLWGEMKRFIQTSKFKLPLYVREDMFMQYLRPDGTADPLSYLIGRVTRKGEGLLGHHIANEERDRLPDGTMLPRTLFLADESSGIDDEAWEKADTWAHRKLAIGNPYPTTNFFYKGVKRGSILDPERKGRFLQKIIHIDSDDSPHVARGKAMIAAGLEPDDKVLIPGILSWQEYQNRLITWDEMRQCIGLHGMFYEGREVKLYPPTWLDRAETIAAELPSHRSGKAMGIDAAEGGDNSVWTVVDEYGLIYMESRKTSDTNDIPGITIAIGSRYGVQPERWLFDRGGGGKQHADRLRAQGYNCASIGFGEGVSDPQAWKRTADYRPKKEVREGLEERYIYKNRRAEMYGTLRLALDPSVLEVGFGLPRDLINLRRTDGGPSLREQLEILPLWYDKEGRLYLPPKSKESHRGKEDKDTIPCIKEMLDGYSPDEADSLVLACYGLTFKGKAVVRSMI
jgi:hypothetical protein